MNRLPFLVQSLRVPLADAHPLRFVESAPAVLAALSRVSERCPHVTVEFDGAEVFGVRHIRWVDGGVHDSGWRVYRGASFVGVVSSLAHPALGGIR